MWKRNIFFPLYPIVRRSFLCNQRPCAAVFSFSIPSHPGPLSCLDPGNTAFNRSLVYRCTLTLHLLIASVIAFLRIRRKFVRSSVRFWKIVTWILDKPYSGCIIARRAHPRTHKHTYTNVCARWSVRYNRWSACSSWSRNIFGSLHGELSSREISLFPRVRRKNEWSAIILHSLMYCPTMRGREKEDPINVYVWPLWKSENYAACRAWTPYTPNIQIDYRIYNTILRYGLVISQFAHPGN